MAPKSVSTQTLAKYLTTGYWDDKGHQPHSFPSHSISVNLGGLDDNERALAKAAFAAWETVANIDFSFVTGKAKMTFDPNYEDGRDPLPDATTDAAYGGGDTDNAKIKINSDWLYGRGSFDGYGTKIGEYAFHTYMHEIGHALGLGHSSPGGGYSSALFQNDSWQQTVMSYHDQDENTDVNADKAVTVSAMMADIVAIQELYGRPTSGPTAGDTRYGVGSDLGTYLDGVFGSGPGSLSKNAMTIFDISGVDTFRFSNDTQDQVVNLNAGTFSSVYGKTGNLGIAYGTKIENYIAGSGDDRVTGNASSNQISLGEGNDRASGGGASDLIYGKAGADELRGGGGADVLRGGDGSDILMGDDGNDILNGNGGNDRLSGGNGSDIFAFTGGRDTITYFANNIDTVKFDDALWGGGSKSSLAQVLAQADVSVLDGNLRIDFGDGDVLTILKMTGVNSLADDWGII